MEVNLEWHHNTYNNDYSYTYTLTCVLNATLISSMTVNMARHIVAIAAVATLSLQVQVRTLQSVKLVLILARGAVRIKNLQPTLFVLV